MLQVKKNSIPLLAGLVMVLIGASITLAYRNNQIIAQQRLLQEQADQIKQRSLSIVSVLMHGLDLGLRGYALTKQEFLLAPFKEAIAQKDSVFFELERLLQAQHYDATALHTLKGGIDEYVQHCQYMVALARKDSMAEFRQLLQVDKGTALWEKCVAFRDPLFAYEDQLNQQAQAQYQMALTSNRWVQVLLFLIGLPTLALLIYQFLSNTKSYQVLLRTLEENNRKYLFDSGEGHRSTELIPQQVIDTSIQHLQRASAFVNCISEGDYQTPWEGFNESNRTENTTTLAGRLLKMRQQMKQVQIEEEKRRWVNEGIAQFSDATRRHQGSPEVFVHETIRFLTTYLSAQQGSLFVLRQLDGQASYLDLAACYAFERRKYGERRVELGQGLVGQTFLEAQTTLITDLPAGYTAITSGLGEATPTCLVIVPMKHNNQVVAMLELASFGIFPAYQIGFLEKCGEYVASTLTAGQTTEKMRGLIEELQQRTQEMQAQEEEIRQNMEELLATQENERRLRAGKPADAALIK